MRTEHHSCTIEEETSKTEIIQASNANLIISVIETTQRGKELNDAHQRLLTSLGEIADSKAHHSTSKLLLSLAWRWNKFDFAQNEIQFPDPMSACDEITSLTHVTNVTIADTLFEILGNDQADFVELLLPTELNVNYEDLEKLYSDVLGGNAVSDTIKMFIKKQLHWIQPNEDTYQSRTPSEFPLLSRVGNLLNAQFNNMSNPYSDQKRPIGFVDLFLFAILFNRQQLGELMWKHCQDKLGIMNKKQLVCSQNVTRKTIRRPTIY
ncbi:hypothetical protein DPMN_029691 [Dreissena polymorpha]|uniref:Uncharacterized protein n=1 Tax=Dreissena polymorpha TaxID=45954 RepID=A0A9D4RFN6_DREPO|nr:hypothetical protein DPMN_029691 [Dreissena polymorpha]